MYNAGLWFFPLQAKKWGGNKIQLYIMYKKSYKILIIVIIIIIELKKNFER